MEIKKVTFSFFSGFIECHLSREVLEARPGDTREGDQHLPPFPSYPGTPTMGKRVAQPMQQWMTAAIRLGLTENLVTVEAETNFSL